MARTTKILNVIYRLSVVFFLLDSHSSFDIKSQVIKHFVYFGLLIGTPLLLIWNVLFIKPRNGKIIGTLFPIVIMIMILVVGPMKLVFYSSTWCTQTILYQHRGFSAKKIEFQIQDVGALGYNKRTVRVFYLTPFFIITSKTPTDIDKSAEWFNINKDVNELGLKEP